MQVDASMLAEELRRRRVGPRYLVDALDCVDRSTWVLGELCTAPTSLLVLAAFSLTSEAADSRSHRAPTAVPRHAARGGLAGRPGSR
jgi:hypothetical protein